jgi:PAS domain-containing protein
MLACWDRDLRCRFANRAYETWFGADPDRLLGISLRDLLGPELFAVNEPIFLAALRGEEQTFERVVQGPDGLDRHSLANFRAAGRVGSDTWKLCPPTALNASASAGAR